MNYRIGFLLMFLGVTQVAFAQLDTIYNTNSSMFKTTERIAYYEQLYRFRVTRFVDLSERQNKGFKSQKADIGRLIIDLVNQKKISPWSSAFGDPAEFDNPMNDTVALILSSNFVASNTRGKWSPTTPYQAGEMVIVEITEKGITDKIVFQANVDNTGKDPAISGNEWNKLDAMNTKLTGANVVGVELVEDVIFDKRRSRLTYDILAIGVCYMDGAGALQTRFYIRYADLVAQIEKMAKSNNPSDRRQVYWANRYNPSENKKFTEALKLRLFHGVIRKVENPDNMSIMEVIYDKNTGRGSYSEGVFAMWEQEMQMMEKEHNLWEF